MITELQGLSFDDACARLESNGYIRLSEGDWAYVYAAPHGERVIRLTPYDPAYLVFIQMCWTHPHRHLPTIMAVARLAGYGYASEMPRYERGDVDRRTEFLEALQTALETDEDPGELAELCQVLKRGLAAGRGLSPYFGDIDWNIENVLLNGATPVLIDAFTYAGPLITDNIASGVPMELPQAEIDSFLSIPYHRRGQKQFGE